MSTTTPRKSSTAHKSGGLSELPATAICRWAMLAGLVALTWREIVMVDQHHVVAVDASQIAMQGLGRMQHITARSGGSQSGGNFLPN